MTNEEPQGHRIQAVRSVPGQSSWAIETAFYEAFSSSESSCTPSRYHASRQGACLAGGEDV